MRRLTIKVKEGEGEQIRNIAKEHDGKNLMVQSLQDGELVTVHLNNQKVSSFVESVSAYEEAEINLIPRGVISLYPPPGEAPDQVADVLSGALWRYSWVACKVSVPKKAC